MSPQPDLFSGASYPEAPGYQRTDTSRAAAEAMKPKARHLRQKIIDILTAVGPMTTMQIAERLGLPYESIQPRTAELRATDCVVDSGQRGRSRDPQKTAIVWQVKEKA